MLVSVMECQSGSSMFTFSTRTLCHNVVWRNQAGNRKSCIFHVMSPVRILSSARFPFVSQWPKIEQDAIKGHPRALLSQCCFLQSDSLRLEHRLGVCKPRWLYSSCCRHQWPMAMSANRRRQGRPLDCAGL